MLALPRTAATATAGDGEDASGGGCDPGDASGAAAPSPAPSPGPAASAATATAGNEEDAGGGGKDPTASGAGPAVAPRGSATDASVPSSSSFITPASDTPAPSSGASLPVEQEGGVTYDTADNLCFIDSLVHLVAFAFPKFNLPELSQSSVADDDRLKALQEFALVVDSVRAGGEAVKIGQLGQLMSIICPGVEAGVHGDPSECWGMLVNSMEEYVDMSFCQLQQVTQSVCSSCEIWSTGSDVVRVVISRLGGLKNGPRYTVGNLLQEEFRAKTETLDDYVCQNTECRVFRRRQEIKQEIEVLQKGSDNGEKIRGLGGERNGFQGTQKTRLKGTPS
ncbi:unnamed protein product, partial [Ectocarpus sp. 12 AP-2014]